MIAALSPCQRACSERSDGVAEGRGAPPRLCQPAPRPKTKGKDIAESADFAMDFVDESCESGQHTHTPSAARRSCRDPNPNLPESQSGQSVRLAARYQPTRNRSRKATAPSSGAVSVGLADSAADSGPTIKPSEGRPDGRINPDSEVKRARIGRDLSGIWAGSARLFSPTGAFAAAGRRSQDGSRRAPGSPPCQSRG